MTLAPNVAAPNELELCAGWICIIAPTLYVRNEKSRFSHHTRVVRKRQVQRVYRVPSWQLI